MIDTDTVEQALHPLHQASEWLTTINSEIDILHSLFVRANNLVGHDPLFARQIGQLEGRLLAIQTEISACRIQIVDTHHLFRRLACDSDEEENE